MKTAYITHKDCLGHQMFAGHPESPGRLVAIHDQLQNEHLWDSFQHFEAPKAERAALLRVHKASYIEHIFSNAPKSGEALFEIDPDTCMNERSLPAALKAAGAGVLAVDLVLEKKVDNAFCAVRPPGHHAEPGRGMGFCLFNNIAIAAAYALDIGGLERIAIIDFDVHHGNGTEAIFVDDPRVLICSSYQHPFYPYSGCTTVPGHIINSPLPQGADGAEFRMTVQNTWLPELEAFAPQLILVSAGFDAHWQEQIAQLQFTEADYAWVTTKLLQIAERSAQGRMVSMLEGGYALNALGRSVAQHLRVLMGLDG